MSQIQVKRNTDRAERFEVAFNQIHLKLKDLAPNSQNDNFTYLLHKVKDKHTSIRYHFPELRQFAKLRNAIVHEKVKESYYIADPHQDVVDEIETISKALLSPPLGLSIASRDVLSFTTDTHIKVILNAFAEKGYSQFPIYENGVFKGLLTEGGIAKWFSTHVAGDFIPVGETRAAEILKIEKPHNVSFIARDATIYDVEDLFESYFDRNQKLEAALVTENGTTNQSPIGIITTWDLVQIDRTKITLIP
ncbi:CBS domain-containing protein [Pseudalkalibacillus sp. SCS-8]|uniref:CBS domain-containing protein n=1 Tax=Pseudalkalibacillus nanhaiensis TaxID=3115291 RepID=UPI0032DA9459